MKFIALILVAGLSFACAHVHLFRPLSRTSIQTRPDLGAQPPFWWDHYAVWCNNVQQDTAFSRCGRCGETFGNRDVSQGGIFDKGVIMETYTAGSLINITARYGAVHFGGFQVELCPFVTETDNCFQVLPMISSNFRIVGGNRLCVPHEHGIPGGSNDVSVMVRLPANVRCNRCTIRFTHRTFYPWSPEWAQDNCFTPLPTQTFRNCADVRIV